MSFQRCVRVVRRVKRIPASLSPSVSIGVKGEEAECQMSLCLPLFPDELEIEKLSILYVKAHSEIHREVKHKLTEGSGLPASVPSQQL